MTGHFFRASSSRGLSFTDFFHQRALLLGSDGHETWLYGLNSFLITFFFESFLSEHSFLLLLSKTLLELVCVQFFCAHSIGHLQYSFLLILAEQICLRLLILIGL